MKKKHLINGCLFVLFAAACQPTEPKTNNAQDNAATDSVATEIKDTNITENKVVEAEKDTVLPFMSPDAMLYDVRGEVKEMTITSIIPEIEEEKKDTVIETIVFDNNGYEVTERKIKRNDKGQLIALDYESEEFEEFTYNELGQLIKKATIIKSGNWETEKEEYSYNEQGELANSTSTHPDSNGYYADSCEYKIQERDHLGNWTKRNIYRKRTYEDKYQTANWVDEIEEARKITYR